MKNIHIIPTDKPSRLHYFTANKAGYYLYPNNELVIPNNPNCKNQNIYITSDEEIKDSWVLNTHTNVVYFLKGYYGIQPITKKIILTTDQDLIKNGIQAIDDEFLEWFVKNPSCEEVIVTNLYGDFNPIKYDYKIIIPKVEPKQETLEEAAEKYVEDFDLSFYDTVEEIPVKELGKKDFIEGAKCQQQNSYSEEEVKKLLLSCKDRFGGADLDDYTPDSNVIKWFEQIKKK